MQMVIMELILVLGMQDSLLVDIVIYVAQVKKLMILERYVSHTVVTTVVFHQLQQENHDHSA